MKLNKGGVTDRGDRDAFLALYKSHYQALYCYGATLTTNKELTKDCLQELFLELWHKQTYLSKEIKNFRSYLFTWLRRKIVHELSLVISKNRTGENTPTSEMCYEELLIAFQTSEEQKENLRVALKKLTKQQLEMIRLKFFENLSYAEIAAQTNLTPRTIYNLIYQAIRMLREHMHFPVIRSIAVSSTR